MEATILLAYEDARIARAVAEAVSPDNFKTPKSISVKTSFVEKRVITKIECEEKLSTFIATVDDLLFCVSTAEKVLESAMRHW